MFNFVPRTALTFHAAINARDDATVDALMRDFFVPDDIPPPPGVVIGGAIAT